MTTDDSSSRRQHTCRICRMEGSETNKLYHPCQCKGSIKYVHEVCLFEWMTSKDMDLTGASIKPVCDICNYPFRLKTMYDADMPKRIPISTLITRYAPEVWEFVKMGLTITVLIFLCQGLPLAWNMWGKWYIFMINEFKSPVVDRPWYYNLIYGFYEETEQLRNGWDSVLGVLVQVILNTGYSFMQMLMVIVLHTALFFLYDMIAREEVFPAMVAHKIGPNRPIVERLQRKIKEQFPTIGDEVIEKLISAIELRGQRAAEGLNDLERFDTDTAQTDAVGELDDEQSSAADSNQSMGESEQETGNTTPEQVETTTAESEIPADGIGNENRNANRGRVDVRYLEAVRELEYLLQEELLNDELQPPPEPDVEPHPVRVNRVQELRDDGENVRLRGGGATLINIRLTISNVFIYFFTGVLLIGIYMFLAYVLPTVVGWFLIYMYLGIGKAALGVVSTLIKSLRFMMPAEITNKLLGIAVPHTSTFYHAISDKFLLYYGAYTNNETWAKKSLILCSLPVLVTYLTVVSLICMAPNIISKGYGRENPMRSARKRALFQLLFAFKCTMKVFALFSIELAGYPILAGAMVDYSLLTPLILTVKEKLVVSFSFKYFPALAVILHWCIGTLYMYWFANFIGLVRQHIIRPGVLFFIRSPDDPNIKILNDSLIHPMRLQLSRLLMSILIYAIFIICGFGLHTRVLLPYLVEQGIFPVYSNIVGGFQIGLVFSAIGSILTNLSSSQKLKSCVIYYWQYVFTVCCRKLRLSSFILGKTIPMERGYITYRNAFYKYLASSKAQWSNANLFSCPTTLSQAKQLFQSDPTVHAYFIPDGCLMRVPANDIISKNYLHMLFVPVTKDDKLLKPLDLRRIRERSLKNSGEFGYLDKQITDFDAYHVVYLPPNFTIRYSMLIILIWGFASILFIGVGLFSNMLGRLVLSGLIYLPSIFSEPFSYGLDSSKAGCSLDFSQVKLLPVLAALDLQCRLLNSGILEKMYRLLIELWESAKSPNVDPNVNDDVTGNREDEDEDIVVFAPNEAVVNLEDFKAKCAMIWGKAKKVFVDGYSLLKNMWFIDGILTHLWIVSLHFLFLSMCNNIAYGALLFKAYYHVISTSRNPADQGSPIYCNRKVSFGARWFEFHIISATFFGSHLIFEILFIGIYSLVAWLSIRNVPFLRKLPAFRRYSIKLAIYHHLIPSVIICVLQNLIFLVEQSGSVANKLLHCSFGLTLCSKRDVPLTPYEHMFYFTGPVVLGCYYTAYIYAWMRKHFKAVKQWLIDDIYGTGKSLVNLEEDD